MDNNIHEVEFGNSTLTQIEQLYQYDKGQILKITDKVEDGTEVQFSNGNSETTINKAINDSQVEIPDILLQENKKILAYLKIINSDSETTIKTVIIPVKARTKPADYIEPEQEKPFRKYVEEKLENGDFTVKERRIYLRKLSGTTIYHELGHFVAWISGNRDTTGEFKAIYEKEKNL